MSGALGSSKGKNATGMPKFQAQGLQNAAGQAADLFNNPPSLWQGPQIAPLSGATQQSYQTGTDAAARLDSLAPTLNKAFSDSTNMDIYNLPEYKNAANDITQRLSQQFQRTVVPGINESFAANGAFGGSDQQLGLGLAAGDLSTNTGSALTSLATNLFGIQAGRSNTALSSIPGLILGNTAGYNTLKDVGNAQDTRMQSELSDTINSFNANQMAPEDALDRYIQRLQGNYVQRNSTNGSTFGSVVQGGVGGALAANGTGQNPWLGGLLGGLAGLL